jgi:transglutaminase-like putative cysteine protease
LTILKIDVELDYLLAAPTDLILALEAAALPDQVLRKAQIDLPKSEHFARVPADGGIGERLLLRMRDRLTCAYSAEVEITRTPPALSGIAATPIHMLPGEVVQYLMASRFCPADQFQSYVQAEFGGVTGGAAVAAMCDWIAQKMAYVPGQSDAQTTALESFVQRKGVCRDFAHVLITFARAASIPARMVSGYAPDVTPQDFHAVAEVWLDGAWHLVDPTGMAGADEIARICVGRDARSNP